MKTAKPRLALRERLIGILVIASIAAIGVFSIIQLESVRSSQARQIALAKAGEYTHAIEERFYATVSANYALAAMVRQGHGQVSDFDLVADELLRYHQGVIQNLQLAPGGVVSQIHPLAGSEGAIGHNLLADPKRREDALRAIRSRKLTLTGPVNLRQGGNGMIVRLPVFLRDDDGKERFWGFINSLILTQRFLESVDLKALEAQGYHYRLAKNGAVIATNAPEGDFGAAVSAKVEGPNEAWQLSVVPKGGWTDPLPLALEIGLLLAFVALPWRFILAQLRELTLQRELAERSRQLEELNATLEQRIQREVALGREKDLMLVQQSRFAEMGEMIGNIAHQWRQPLNALSLTIANIQDDCAFNELTQDKMDGYAVDSRRLIQKMSQTIDDFRNFFRPHREKTAFSLKAAVAEALSLTSAALGDRSIAVALHADEDLQVWGYSNELSQVLVNLINNAQQAISARQGLDGKIDIALDRDDGAARLTVRDNGGGIPEEVLPKIFEPFFTTKEEGTGLGLSMTRTILETHMAGSIEARNLPGGAEFVVRLPLAAGNTPET
jgi:Signal transduction histidine kinase regulating C4-dicarboxylate transport system